MPEHLLDPTGLNQWFSLDQQRNYVSKLTGRHGLTRRRAEYFVKLWAYLLLKQQQETGKRLVKPLTELSPLIGAIPCTHREAAELFYSHQDRGSDRAAGMMIDQLASLGLIKKQFDGSTICIQIRHLPELTPPPPPEKPIEVKTDAFNPRTDTVLAANLIIRNYNWLNREGTPMHRITTLLRGWAQQYPIGMRVLRRCDNENVVGFYMLYPTARESEEKFFLPPSKSLYVTVNVETDPMILATPGDRDCTVAFVRSWTVDAPFLQKGYLTQFVQDVQQTLSQMHQEFPNLCDLYAMVFHPEHDELRIALGFQKTVEDTQLPLSWIYQPVDRFLVLDVPQALANFQVSQPDELATLQRL